MKADLRRVIGTLLGLMIAILLYFMTDFFFQAAFLASNPVSYIFPQGSNSTRLAFSLHAKGLISNPRMFILMSKIQGKAHNLKAGGYVFNPGITAQKILDKIYQGDYATYKITFVEGWSLQKILFELAKNPYLQHTLETVTATQLAAQFKLAYENPEGWVFPDTYEFYWGTSDREILALAIQRMQAMVAHEWANRAPNLPYKIAYEALIAASLIEKEAHLASEQRLIAGVIVRRLKQRIRLQIDATIIYALGECYQGKISRADLAIQSPYNTYLRYGLPPSPIASPGIGALRAALHPDQTQALYFAALGDGSGSHLFSDNLRSHNAIVKKYILKK